MRIAVVGCGAVGSFYGAKLARDGQDVHFLLRSDYEQVRRHGVSIKSPQGDFHVRPRAARTPEEIGPADLVLVALKSTANSELPRLIPPLVGPATAVMTLQNGLGNEQQLATFLSPEKVLGCLCFVCLNRVAPGVIHHLDHGQVVLGELSGWPEPRTHDFATAFRHAGIPCAVSDNLARARWEKLTWNIPFNGLGVASAAGLEAFTSSGALVEIPKRLEACLTTDKLLASTSWEKLVRELMFEVIAAARTLGYNLPDSLAEKQIERTRSMGAYKASTLIDFERGQPLELETLFLEPLRQAKAAEVEVPRLERLCAVLKRLAQYRSNAFAREA
jgi:2-dehydropantoate 2-reductase